MAQIPVEKKRGTPVWIWLLALLLLLLLLWWLFDWLGDDEDVTPVADAPVVTEEIEPITPVGTPEMVDDEVTLGDITTAPDRWIGRSFPQMQVVVAEVPTDRGFWIEGEGERLLVLVEDQPQEQRVDINPGQTVRIDGGTLRSPDYLPQLGGDPIESDTESLVREQEIFLVTDERNITILEAGQPQPGTDPAQDIQ